jgi:E3 ubiquitin-protein ligase UBR1
VFLLQLGFVTLPPNRFLTTLLDRFDLVDWFLGKKTHDYYDASQTIFMVEEILNLLIVIACERANVSGMSILDKIRREIIHNLCLSSSAYSDLTKRIPERITEHPEFDRILAEVAHFKSPDGVNDHGSYELKDEYFASVDTYFWHFSRNNREEAESILKARWKKANPNEKEQDFFILPKNVPIAPGPFRHLGSFLQSTVFVRMLTSALWNTFAGDNHKSDTILDQIMYLILLALTDENSEDVSNYGQGKFYDYVCSLYFTLEMPPSSGNNESGKTRRLSLFDVMTILYEEEQYVEVLSRFNWIFEQLEVKGVDNTRDLVKKWRYEYNARMQRNAQKKQDEGNGGVTELSEVEKKKLAAKERQLKIMAQFAQAQSQFMEKNEYLYDDEEDDAFVDAPDTFSGSHANEGGSNDSINSESLHQFCAYPTGTCIVCQEDVNDRSLPYGLLGLIQTSNIMRETPMDDSSLFNDIYNMGPNLDVDWQDRQCLPDDAESVSGFPAQLHKTGLYASSCGHLMHIKCFEVYCTSIDSRHSSQLTRNHPENRSRKEFMCPLCKSLGNALLPVFWKGKRESFPGVLAKAREADYANFYKTGVIHIANKLKHTIVASSRHAQMKKPTGREPSSTSRMKDVMAHLLPNLPLMGAPGAANPTAAVGGTAATMNAGAGRDWAAFGLAARLPLPTPLDNNNIIPGLDPIQPAALTETPAQAPQDGDMMNVNVEDDEAERDVEAMLMQSALNPDSLPLPDGQLGPFENDTLHSTAMVSAPFIKKSYQRLLDVLGIIYQEICTDENEREMSTAAENVDMLWGIMGYTIAGVEIASRGASRSSVAQEHRTTNTLFDQIPPQTQMLLRIFSDTVMAYTTLMCPGAGTDSNKSTSATSISMARVSMFSLGRMRQMFEITVDDVVNLPAGPSQKIVLYDNAPILQDDPFMILTELSLHLIPMTQTDIFPFVRTLLLAEFAKAAVGLLQDRLSREAEQDIHQTAPSESSHNIAAAKSFAFSLMSKLRFTSAEAQHAFQRFESEASFCALLKFFVLPFLRRTLILMIVRFGLIVPSSASQVDEMAADEFERLLNILHLPSFADFLQPTPMTESLLHYWCSQHVRESERRIQVEEGALTCMSANRLIHISLNLPTPIFLVALPKRLDRLFDESMKRVCQKCGTVPSDPALCLFCGTFVCSQSFCCAEDEEGECNLHTLE